GPDVPIMVDTNCPWTVAEAVEMARRLAPLDLAWLEEPVWPPENVAGLAEVRVRGGIPTAAGENYGTIWDFRRAFEAGAITYAQPSVTKIGGGTDLRRGMTLRAAPGVTAPASPPPSTPPRRCPRGRRWSASTATSPRIPSAGPSTR